ncbi:two-component system sensor histidine kinase RppB [Egbenema bharatensis]|uniref:two-component system sensor histidine kinase RppB n=1 Tax=Egbenema bharatensis TaxID=3463334 RepID=UPI003A8A05C9
MMNRNHAFSLTRKRLAGLYAGTMGLILAACGFGFYESMAHEHWESLNRKLATVAGTLHDGIEPVLEQPGKVEPIVDHFLPGLVCVNGTQCPEQAPIAERHIAGVVQQENYYIRFVDPNGKILATVGQQPEGVSLQIPAPSWQTLQAGNGTSYRQVSLFLKTRNQSPWGYIQVGESLEAYETHLARVRWTLIIGLPIAMLLVAGASWWLSGVAMRPVYQSYRQIQQFTADAAHELRTPLAAIRSTVEFTLDEPELSESEVRNTLRIIERQNNRLSNLVQDLLLLSRLDLQGNVIRLSLCCLNTLIEDLIEEFSALAIASDLILKADIQTSQTLIVLGNEEQLYRSFANLMTNAMQYTPPGGIVIMQLNQEEENAILSVKDTGIGISLVEQSRIFDRFYRVNSDRSRKTGGAGLGLSIAQAIVQAHHGKIQVQSDIGKGSVFTVRLPLQIS